MTISQTLWQQNQDLAQASLNHPFVQGIADGSLEKHCFTFYVGQDVFFLQSFARAYSIAAAKVPDWEGFKFFHELAGGILEELNLHQTYAQQWGVNLQKVTPSLATRRYTDFLLATAWGQAVGLTAAAMTPCMRLYYFLGTELAKDGTGNHQYSDWIKTYSNSEFRELVSTLETLVDRYVKTTEQEANQNYRYALLCERDFFAAAWEQANS